MIDLFKICVDKSRLHPNFINLLGKEDSIARAYINSWTNGFVDRDKKLRIEFQTTFNSSFWELYLFNVFKKWGFYIDFQYKYPDFVIKEPFNVCVEAVIANNAITDRQEWNRNYKEDLKDKLLLENIVRTATIRLANAIIYKYKKYKDQYSSDDYIKDKPFFIAIAPFEQPYFWEQTQRAIGQVLYGYKKTLYKNIDDKNERVILGHEYISHIEKDNGSEIPLGFFSENMMPEISGVIFSNVATIGKIRALTKNEDSREMLFMFSKYNRNGLYANEGAVRKKDYTEELEDGLGLFLNPYCIKEFPEGFIELFPNTSFYDIEERCIKGEGKDGDLINRMVNVFTIMDD
jgi:hypothetical protein